MRASGGCRAFARDDALEHAAKRRGRKVRHLDLGVLDGSYQTLESAILVRRHLRRIGDFDRTRFHDAFTSRRVMLKTQRVNRRLTCTCMIVAPAPVQSPPAASRLPAKWHDVPRRPFEIFRAAAGPWGCSIPHAGAGKEPAFSSPDKLFNSFPRRSIWDRRVAAKVTEPLKRGGFCNDSSDWRYRAGFRSRHHRGPHPLS